MYSKHIYSKLPGEPLVFVLKKSKAQGTQQSLWILKVLWYDFDQLENFLNSDWYLVLTGNNCTFRYWRFCVFGVYHTFADPDQILTEFWAQKIWRKWNFCLFLFNFGKFDSVWIRHCHMVLSLKGMSLKEWCSLLLFNLLSYLVKLSAWRS